MADPAGIFFIDLHSGVRTVREANSLRAARALGRREFGTAFFKDAERATLDDLVRVKRCGGWLPEGIRPAVEARERELYPPKSPPPRVRGHSARRYEDWRDG